jgi:hypothetical protein
VWPSSLTGLLPHYSLCLSLASLLFEILKAVKTMKSKMLDCMPACDSRLSVQVRNVNITAMNRPYIIHSGLTKLSAERKDQ